MSKDYPTLEENIRVIVNDLGLSKILGVVQPREIAQAVDAKQWAQIAQAIPVEQKETLLRVLLEQIGTEKVESILRNEGNRKS